MQLQNTPFDVVQLRKLDSWLDVWSIIQQVSSNPLISGLFFLICSFEHNMNMSQNDQFGSGSLPISTMT